MPITHSDDSLSQKALHRKYESLLTSKKPTEQILKAIRVLIIKYGIPDRGMDERHAICTLRGKIWKALLRSPLIDPHAYTSLLKKGPAPGNVGVKIKKDTHRTFTQNKLFAAKVPEEKLIRVLNAAAHHHAMTQGNGAAEQESNPYVQGMNVLVAPLLYVMPEPDAFACFRRLCRSVCPTYLLPGLLGVHAGAAVVDLLLRELDPELADHMDKAKLPASIWAFGPTLTFGASSPPLSEALRLWDFLMACGFGFSTLQRLILQHLVDVEVCRDLVPSMAKPKPKHASKPVPLTLPSAPSGDDGSDDFGDGSDGFGDFTPESSEKETGPLMQLHSTLPVGGDDDGDSSFDSAAFD
eukprot:gnl/Dysnectes_brevis/4557_a6175_472.p1 GENE.gnl/Dysnectes_brevis/4557_a6175_472~~gnl/Dysnectes_brevis/4557_a6175_472.p1  ORF type:complete len:366 (+),score=103.51 gnl/Dysnectes_brevis/4557_a6175_472:42-1100(+)